MGCFKGPLELLCGERAEAGDLLDSFSKSSWKTVLAQSRGCSRSGKIPEIFGR